MVEAARAEIFADLLEFSEQLKQDSISDRAKFIASASGAQGVLASEVILYELTAIHESGDLGSVLIVGVGSDAIIKYNKGEGRPVLNGYYGKEMSGSV